jgi:hypothetical protein
MTFSVEIWLKSVPCLAMLLMNVCSNQLFQFLPLEFQVFMRHGGTV